MREWLRDDLLIQLWESRPRITEKKNEDETVVKEVQIDSDTGKPIVDEKMRGVSFNILIIMLQICEL